MRQAMGRLQGTLSLAIDELRRIMTTSKTDAVRLKAALFVIEAYGVTSECKQNDPDPVSQTEFLLVSNILKNMGGKHAGT